MERRKRLLLFSPALFGVLALGAAVGSPATATPVSAQTVVANVPHAQATKAPANKAAKAPDKKLKAYRDAYRKGYADAGKNCGKGKISYSGSDWNRKGWVDGYNDGHAALCNKTG